MTRDDWVAACAKALSEKLDMREGDAHDLANILAVNEAQDSGSEDPESWSAPADAADEEGDAWGE